MIPIYLNFVAFLLQGASVVLAQNVFSGADKDAFIDGLVSRMTVPELVLQLHLMFGDNIVGPNSDNGLYEYSMRYAPDASIGVMHDWYPLNKSHYNSVQALNAEKSRLKIPFMHFGECLHGVGSFKQSMFPQSIGMAASFDTDLVHRVGRAIGSEARSIGIHACLSPVLDLGKDPRFGRVQEAWGEDKVLTSHMGVAYASGLSKNGSWSDPDAVVPVIKHFAAYGAPQSGRNSAPWMGRGNREIQQELLVPFKAVIDNGGARGIMMSYNELDDIPAHVHPMLYQALSDWGFDGFVTADDTGMRMLQTQHEVSSSDADTIRQWFNAGGMIQYYDFPLEVYINATIDLVANGTVALTTLQSHVRKILGVKYDLGLFNNPYISGDIVPDELTAQHIPLTLEAAQKSIVLLENRNKTLPLKPAEQGIHKIALIGPFCDTLNYGDYSGQWGAYPVANSITIRQAALDKLAAQDSGCELVSNWGSNTWLYNAQYPIPGYLLSADGSKGGLRATYFTDTNFSNPAVTKLEVPVLDWGLYPPPGLTSNNFSAVWEGELTVPVDGDIDGWLGVAVSANTTAKLYVDGALLSDTGLSASGNILSNIENRAYTVVNSTLPPPGSAPFSFHKGATHTVRLEYQAWNTHQKIENVNSINAEILLFWNLVDQSNPVQKATSTALSADAILLTLGSAWSSDGENGDRATLGLSPNQTALADAVFALGKPVILVLQGGRPLAIPQYYARAAAVLNAFFPGQAGGQAIADALFGLVSPGGRVPLSVPRHEGQLPVFYNQKGSARGAGYVDEDAAPAYPFGYGLSYTEFLLEDFVVGSTSGGASGTFTAGDVVTFAVSVENVGGCAGGYVVQVYLLQRVSSITQPVRQLVAFKRVELEAGERKTVELEVEVDRFLKVVNRAGRWELERGEYVFALLENGGDDADTGKNVTMDCV